MTDDFATPEMDRLLFFFTCVRQRLEATLRIAISKHHAVLHRKRRQAVFKDDYGEDDVSIWQREVTYFANRFADFQEERADLRETLALHCRTSSGFEWATHLEGFFENVPFETVEAALGFAPPRKQTAHEAEARSLRERSAYDLMARGIHGVEDMPSYSDIFGPPLPTVWPDSEQVGEGPSEEVLNDPTGRAYERYCGNQLERAGWAVRLTSVTGDQGADLLAERAGVLLVVQCKAHSRSIGNDAVQQVLGAKSFHRAHLAAVISASPYTSHARQLATTAGVYLLTHSDITPDLFTSK